MTIALPAETAVRRPGRIDLSWPILLLFAALLCVLIILPISWLVYYSLVDRDGAFTLENFGRLAADLETLAENLAAIAVQELRPYRAAAE